MPLRPRAAPAEPSSDARPFDFSVAFSRLRRMLKSSGVADAAMFDLAERGHRSLFEQLVACVISIRTRDETMLPIALDLFARAPSAADVAALSADELDAIIAASTFHRGKAETIRAIAQRTAGEFGGTLPCDVDVLTSFRGVGPKCANLALGIACGQPRIGVDVHVHRVVNRWGVVSAREPVDTMHALEAVLPKRYWVEINRLLVPFGKHVCTGRLPKCSSCPLLDMCRQVGVTAHR